MKKIAIVILNWNGKKLLEEFLPTVVRHSSFPDVEIVVADNGSTDDSLSFLETAYLFHVPLLDLCPCVG